MVGMPVSQRASNLLEGRTPIYGAEDRLIDLVPLGACRNEVARAMFQCIERVEVTLSQLQM